jgi:hypothetical protein
MVQEHNHTLACANTDRVYGIGLHRLNPDRALQLGLWFAVLLQGRAIPSFLERSNF